MCSFRVICLIEQGPGGIWCDVDVVEFSYSGAAAATPKEEFHTALVDGLRGSDPCLGSGSQVPYLHILIQKHGIETKLYMILFHLYSSSDRVRLSVMYHLILNTGSIQLLSFLDDTYA